MEEFLHKGKIHGDPGLYLRLIGRLCRISIHIKWCGLRGSMITKENIVFIDNLNVHPLKIIGGVVYCLPLMSLRDCNEVP